MPREGGHRGNFRKSASLIPFFKITFKILGKGGKWKKKNKQSKHSLTNKVMKAISMISYF